MTRVEILKVIQERVPAAAAREDEKNDEAILVAPAALIEVARLLKEEPMLDFDYNMVITAADWIERVAVVYYFMSYRHQHVVALKVELPNDALRVDTLSHLWASANWFEREVYDLFGVEFVGHPDLRRIMMPSDWEGHPLRKSYTHPNLVPLPDREQNPANYTGMGHHTL